MKKFIQRVFIIGTLAFLFFGLAVVLILVAPGPIQPLRASLLPMITSAVSGSLNGSLEIGGLQGSLLSNPAFRNIVLRDDAGNAVVQLDELRLRYGLSALLRKRLLIHEVTLIRPQLTITQDADGSLNLSRLALPSGADPDPELEPTSDRSGFPIDLELTTLQLRDGQLKLDLPSVAGVQTVDDLQMKLSVEISQQTLQFDLQQFQARTEPAHVNLNILSGMVQKGSEGIHIDNLRVETDSTRITVNGTLPSTSQPASLMVNVAPFDMSEIGRLLADETLNGQVDLTLTATGPSDDVRVASQLRAAGGRIDFAGQFDLASSQPHYQGTLDIAKLDLAALAQRDALKSDLNLHINLDGSGAALDDIQGQVRLEILPSHVGDITLRPSHIHAEATSKRFQIQQFNLDTSVAQMTLNGVLDFAGNSDLNYQLQTTLADLKQLLGTEEVDGTLTLQGTAQGQWPGLTTQGTLIANGLRYQTNQLKTINLAYEASELGAQPQASANLQLQQAQLGTFAVEQVNLTATYDGGKQQLQFATQIQQAAPYDGSLSGTVTLSDSGQDIHLDSLVIRLDDRIWQASEPIRVALHNGNVQLQAFRLIHDDESLVLSGGLEGKQLNDLQLQATQIDLDFLRRLLTLPELVGGRATLATRLTGTFDAPALQIDLEIRAPAQQHQPFERLHATLNYARQRLNSEVYLRQQGQDTIALALQLPIDMAFTGLTWGQRLQPQPVSMRLDIAQPDLAAIQRGLSTLPPLTGTLEGAIDLRGTYAQLALDTDLTLKNLGLKGTIENLNAPLQLTGTLVTAESVPALAKALTEGNLTAVVRDLVLRAARIDSILPGLEEPNNAIRLTDLLVQADGKWTPNGLSANLHTLELQAQALDLPRTQLALSGNLTPQYVNLSRLQINMPKSELTGSGRFGLSDQTLDVKIEILRLRLDELARALPDTIPPELKGNIRIEGSVAEPEVAAHLRYAGAHIDINVSAKLQEPTPQYRADLRIKNLDIARFAPDLKGRLSTNVRLNGSGFDEQNRQATLEVDVNSNAFSLAPGLTARIQADVQGSAMTLNTMRLQSAPVSFSADGSISESQIATFNYALKLDDLTSIRDNLGLDLDAKGQLTGELSGPLNALQTQAKLQLKEWRYTTFKGQTLTIEVNSSGLPTTPEAKVTASLDAVQGPSLPKSNLKLDATYHSDQGDFNLAVTEGPFQKTEIAGKAEFKDGQHITLNTLRLQRQEWMWANPSPITIARDAKGRLDIPQFVLRNGDEVISLQANLTPEGSIGGKIGIRQLRIQPNVQALAPDAATPDGQLNVDLNLGGTLENPAVEGTLELDALQWQGNAMGDIKTEIELANNTLQSNLRWFDQQTELLRANGQVGLGPDGTLEMRINASDFDLARLKSYSQAVLQSSGTLNIDLNLSGTPSQPVINGDLRLDDGTLQLAATGEPYQDIQTHLRIAGERLTIDQLQVGSHSGNLNLTGWVQTADLALKELDITLDAQDFTAMRTADIEAVVTSNLTARGSLQELDVNGTVTIPRARVRVEGLLGGAPAAVTRDDLSIDVIYGNRIKGQDAAEDKNAASEKKKDPMPFLRANVKVDMPKNIWVQARGTAIELRGDLNVTKKLQSPFIVSGDIETVRGFVSFFGKKFGLENGRITFTGAEEINPTLDVTATHRVSDYVVSVHVEGESKKPKLNLSSAPEELEEADIMSLLLFGKTSDRLSSSEESSLSNRAKNAAAGAAAGAAAQAVGQELGLDTVEVELGDDPSKARVGAGRYITQDIFLSYERQLGEKGGNTVGVEYSLNRRLMLKGATSDSGENSVDILWRLDY